MSRDVRDLDYLARIMGARRAPVPSPWYAARCRSCGWTSPPAPTPERLPTICPNCPPRKEA